MTCDAITPLPAIDCGPLARRAYRLCEQPQCWPALAHACGVPRAAVTSQADAVEWLSDALGVDALAQIDQRPDVARAFARMTAGLQQ